MTNRMLLPVLRHVMRQLEQSQLPLQARYVILEAISIDGNPCAYGCDQNRSNGCARPFHARYPKLVGWLILVRGRSQVYVLSKSGHRDALGGHDQMAVSPPLVPRPSLIERYPEFPPANMRQNGELGR